MGGFILLTVLWVAMGTEEGPGDVQPPHGGVIRGAGPLFMGPGQGQEGPCLLSAAPLHQKEKGSRKICTVPVISSKASSFTMALICTFCNNG